MNAADNDTTDPAWSDHAPPARFNFAAHLIEGNAARGAKAAFVDDHGALSYAASVRELRASSPGLRALGIRREERVLVLMHDCKPLAGGLPRRDVRRAGAGGGEYAAQRRRLRLHARAFARAGGTGLGRTAADAERGHGQERSRTAQGDRLAPDGAAAPLGAGLRCLRRRAAAAAAAVRHRPRRPGLLALLQRLHRLAKVPCIARQPYWTAELYGRAVLGLRESDVCFSAAVVLRLRAGQCLELSAQRGRDDAVDGRAADARGGVRWTGGIAGAPGLKPTVFYGAPTGLRRHAWRTRSCRGEAITLRPVSSAGEALPAEIGERFERAFGIVIVDGIGSTEMLHIFRPTGPSACATAPPAGRWRATDELRDENRRGRERRAGRALYPRPSAALLMYWGNREKTRETFQGWSWTKSGDKYLRNDDGSYTYCGRSDDMLKVSGIYVSPFEVEATLVQHPAVLEAAVIG